VIPEGLSDSDRRRVRRALQAALERLDGVEYSARTLADVKWFERRLADDERRRLFAAFPKGLLGQLSGRRHAQLDDLAAKHRLPWGDGVVDLASVLRRVFDLLAELRPRGSIDDDIDGDFAELERAKLREEVRKLIRQNELLMVELDENQGKLIPRDEIRDRLGWLSSRLRSLGTQFRRCKTGDDAADKLNEALEQIAAEIADGTLQW
jgi:hypothetical protein